MSRSAFTLAAMLALVSSAMAQQQPAALDDLDAERVDAQQVRIEFDYGGSACEAVDTAEVGEVTDGKAAITFPTTSTAEMCTQQLVEIEVDQVVALDETATAVEVTLLRPDGSVLATGTDGIERD